MPNAELLAQKWTICPFHLMRLIKIPSHAKPHAQTNPINMGPLTGSPMLKLESHDTGTQAPCYASPGGENLGRTEAQPKKLSMYEK
jgi:hypothetical protein